MSGPKDSIEAFKSRCEMYQNINADLTKKVQELKVLSSNFQSETIMLRNVNLVEQNKVFQFQRTLLDIRTQGKRFIRDFEQTMAQVIAKTGIQVDEDDYEPIDPLQFRPASRVNGYQPTVPIDQYQYILNTVVEEPEDDTSSQNSFAPCDDVIASTPLLPTLTGGRKVLGDIKNTNSSHTTTSPKLKSAKKSISRRSKTPKVADINELLPLETPQRANVPAGTRKLSNELMTTGYDSTQASSIFTHNINTVIESNPNGEVSSSAASSVSVTERSRKTATKSSREPGSSNASTNKTTSSINSTAKSISNSTEATPQASSTRRTCNETPDVVQNVLVISAEIHQSMNPTPSEVTVRRRRKSIKQLPTSEQKDGSDEDDNDLNWEVYDEEQSNVYEKYNKPCKVNLSNATVTNSQVEGFEDLQVATSPPKKSPKPSAKRIERKRKSPEESKPPTKSGASKKKRLAVIEDSDDDDEADEVEPVAMKTPKKAKKSKQRKSTKKRKSIETLIRTSSSMSKKRRSSGAKKLKPTKSSADEMNMSDASTESNNARPTRRCRPTTLREPSLMKKMRR